MTCTHTQTHTLIVSSATKLQSKQSRVCDLPLTCVALHLLLHLLLLPAEGYQLISQLFFLLLQLLFLLQVPPGVLLCTGLPVPCILIYIWQNTWQNINIQSSTAADLWWETTSAFPLQELSPESVSTAGTQFKLCFGDIFLPPQKVPGKSEGTCALNIFDLLNSCRIYSPF